MDIPFVRLEFSSLKLTLAPFVFYSGFRFPAVCLRVLPFRVPIHAVCAAHLRSYATSLAAPNAAPTPAYRANTAAPPMYVSVSSRVSLKAAPNRSAANLVLHFVKVFPVFFAIHTSPLEPCAQGMLWPEFCVLVLMPDTLVLLSFSLNVLMPHTLVLLYSY